MGVIIDINAANIEAKKWCQEEISHRICSSTGAKPIDVFKNEEKVQLISLPLSSFDMPEWTIGKVHKIKQQFFCKFIFYLLPQLCFRIQIRHSSNPIVTDFQKNRCYKPKTGFPIGENTNNLSSSPNLLINTFCHITSP